MQFANHFWNRLRRTLHVGRGRRRGRSRTPGGLMWQAIFDTLEPRTLFDVDWVVLTPTVFESTNPLPGTLTLVNQIPSSLGKYAFVNKAFGTNEASGAAAITSAIDTMTLTNGTLTITGLGEDTVNHTSATLEQLSDHSYVVNFDFDTTTPSTIDATAEFHAFAVNKLSVASLDKPSMNAPGMNPTEAIAGAGAADAYFDTLQKGENATTVSLTFDTESVSDSDNDWYASLFHPATGTLSPGTGDHLLRAFVGDASFNNGQPADINVHVVKFGTLTLAGAGPGTVTNSIGGTDSLIVSGAATLTLTGHFVVPSAKTSSMLYTINGGATSSFTASGSRISLGTGVGAYHWQDGEFTIRAGFDLNFNHLLDGDEVARTIIVNPGGTCLACQDAYNNATATGITNSVNTLGYTSQTVGGPDGTKDQHHGGTIELRNLNSNSSTPTYIKTHSAMVQEVFKRSGTSDVYLSMLPGSKAWIVHNSGAGKFSLFDADGQVLAFKDFTGLADDFEGGRLDLRTDPGGHTTSYSYYAHLLSEVVTQTGASGLQRAVYTRSDGKTTAIAYSVFNGSSWVAVRSTNYEYYTGSEPEGGGAAGQIKKLVVRDASNHDLDTSYYRYYTSNLSAGHSADIKYAFGSEAYARLLAANQSASGDSVFAAYADTYYEYNDYGQVTAQVVQGAGCSVCSGGLGTYSYSFADSNKSPSDNNTWTKKTVETLPDGTVHTLYFNRLGSVMLDVVSDGSHKWLNYYRYDANGNQILHVSPSGMVLQSGLAYSESYDDLVNYGTSSSYLSASAGLFEWTEYSTSTTATTVSSGEALNFVKAGAVSQGLGGTKYYQFFEDYIKHTVNSEDFFFVAHNVAYPETDVTSNPSTTSGSSPRVTTYSYDWYSGTSQVKSVTTTMPGVSTTHNGPGTSNADATVVVMDEFGRATWTKDGDGYINYTQYDDVTGAVTKTIVDVNTSQTSNFFATLPSGWQSPSTTSALNLITTYVSDRLGRTTKVTDPKGNVAYTLYDDEHHAVFSFVEKQHTLDGGGDGTLTTEGPITMTHNQIGYRYTSGTVTLGGTYTESLTFSGAITIDNYGIVLPGWRDHGTNNDDALLDLIAAGSAGSPQYTLQSLSRSLYTAGAQLIESDTYFNLNGSTSNGYLSVTTLSPFIGSAGTNYYATTFGYDNRGRQAHTVSPTGVITDTVFDALDRPRLVWVGSNDLTSDYDGFGGVTWKDFIFYAQTNSINSILIVAAGPDFSLISATEYDVDSNVTLSEVYTGSSSRTSKFYYDWRDRLVASKSGTSPLLVYNDLDNLGEVLSTKSSFTTETLSYTDGVPNNATSSSTLRAYTVMAYDEQGRTFRTTRFSVDPTTGSYSTVSTDTIISNIWFDHRGNTIASHTSGGPMNKMAYDGAGRTTVNYVTDGGAVNNNNTVSGHTILSGWSDAGAVANDVVVEQTEYTYDANGNAILVTNRQRFHNDSTAAKGDLLNAGDTTGHAARVSFMASYFDAAGRTTATVNAGTNGGSVFTRPANATENAASDTLLVTAFGYNAAGQADSVTDSAGTVSKTYFDNLGRTTKTVANYLYSVNSGNPSTTNTAANVTTLYTYDGANHTLTVTADLPGTDQTTQYVYDSVLNPDFLTKVKYPDKTLGTASTNNSEQVVYTYSNIGEVLTKTDQNGTVHTYAYDDLGRLTTDTVALAGGNPQHIYNSTSNSIDRITYAYDSQGNAFSIRSTHATWDEEEQEFTYTTVNNVKRFFNGFGQLTKEYQEHNGVVSTASSLSVSYAYSDAAHGSRLTSMTYPSGQVLNYSYGSANGLDDVISRTAAQGMGTLTLESYVYMGLSTVVERQQGSGVTQTYVKQGAESNGEAGDQYAGLDRFGRVVDQRWMDSGASSSLFRIQYGYDRASNRLYADDLVYKGSSHVYAYDKLNRLVSDKSGQLTHGLDDVTDWQRRNDSWTLDALGNHISTGGLAGTTSTNTVNSQNQIVTRSLAGDNVAPVLVDWFTESGTAANWDKPGSGDAFDIDSSTADALTTTTVSQDTINGHTESEARAVLLWGESVGPAFASVSIVFPGTGSGYAGIIFGYKSPDDYWMDVIDLSDNHRKIYHVIDAAKGSAVIDTAHWDDVQHTGVAWWPVFVGNGEIEYQTVSGGGPSGRMGLVTSVADTEFRYPKFYPQDRHTDLAGRWDSYALSNAGETTAGAIDASDDALHLSDWARRPVLLKNLNVEEFQATFRFRGRQDWGSVQFMFDANDPVNGNVIRIPRRPTASEVAYGYTREGDTLTTISLGSTLAGIDADDWRWVRITCIGGVVTLKCIDTNGSAPSDGDWSGTSNTYYTTSGFSIEGGRLGFLGEGISTVDDLSVQSWDGAAWVTELVETFDVDGSGNASETLTYDANGNMTYDGVQVYTYDAWNRLMTVSHAYRDGGGVHAGQTFATMAYDGLGRRTMKTVDGTGDLDAATHFYYSGDALLETRNGGNRLLQQYVHSVGYVDALVGVGVASDPANQTAWDTFYYYQQDTTYNVLGMTDDAGVLVERYEYSAHGERQAYVSGGANDPDCYVPVTLSQVSNTEGTLLNAFGHQGLWLDVETGLIYNRARYLHTELGQFISRDPEGYVDGLNDRLDRGGNPIYRMDPTGLLTIYGVDLGSIPAINPQHLQLDIDKLLKLDQPLQPLTDFLIDKGVNADYAKYYSHKICIEKKPSGGPVIFYPPPGATPAQIKQVERYVQLANRALTAGDLSPTGRVSPTKTVVGTTTLAKLAQRETDREKGRPGARDSFGDPYTGQTGHAPDTSWVGLGGKRRPGEPPFWINLDKKVNESLAGQNNRYPPGYKPTVFLVGPVGGMP